MHKLTSRKPRHDFDIYNESCSIFLSDESAKAIFEKEDSDHKATKIAVEKKQLMAVALDQDDGFVARVVLGNLNAKEKSEWFGRESRLMDLSVGRLVVSGGLAFLSEDLDDEFYQVLEVPPAEYLVTVYHHLPSVNADRLTRLPDWPGAQNWLLSTQPKVKVVPEWLFEFIEFADDDDVELDEKLFDENDTNAYVAFVIQLKKTSGSATESETDGEGFCKTELRIPKKCPLGIPAVGVESGILTAAESQALEEQEEREHAQRFSDEKDIASIFRPFAQAVFEQRFDDCSEFFVNELKPKIAAYIPSQLNNSTFDDMLKKIAAMETGTQDQQSDETTFPELHDCWRDGEAAETSIPRWQSSNSEGNNLFVNDDASEENYLGEIRCQFGDDKAYIKGDIDRMVMIDLFIIDTTDGPKAAGISIY